MMTYECSSDHEDSSMNKKKKSSSSDEDPCSISNSGMCPLRTTESFTTSHPLQTFHTRKVRLKVPLLPSWRFLLLIQWAFIQVCLGADLAIQIPVSDFQDPNGIYRLDYNPPVGYPEPNSTFLAADISDTINFSRGLPGTKYSFRLHYTNNTIHDWLTWTASITTTPDPPANLSINVRQKNHVQFNWDPPGLGGFSKFKLRLISHSDPSQQPRNFIEEKPPVLLRDLTVAGASYEIQLYTIFENKESTAYISGNFTTKPNTPGRFIVWYRNETTLLVLWQPPYPAGVFSGYKVQIQPEDALESILYVSKEGEPPGPAQAAFNNLRPGRAYNISVETVSEDQISPPTTAQYRTIPLRPGNLTFDQSLITTTSFQAAWLPPAGYSEFDRYQIQLKNLAAQTPITVLKDAPLVATFDKNLEPGHSYTVVVKTFSDKVSSWATNANVTTRPSPVINVVNTTDPATGDILIEWDPDPRSQQDHYKITSQEAEAFGGDVNTVLIEHPQFLMSSLFPGRNYSISIQAVSNSMESDQVQIFQATRPSSPIVENITALDRGLTISWKSDVTSKQDKYLVIYTRNDTGETFNVTTEDSKILVSDLYPGAAYNIQLFAVSHGLRSERHDYFQTVFPNPPKELKVLKVTNTTIHCRWSPPVNSLYSGYVLKYRTDENHPWTELSLPQFPTEKILTNLTAGEKYYIKVNTNSYRTESINGPEIFQTVRPSGISEVKQFVDASNITLSWPRPPGRIEAYKIKWAAIDRVPSSPDQEDGESPEHIDDSKSELLNGEKTVSQKDWEDPVKIPISPLMSGVAYNLRVETFSNDEKGDEYNTTIRTLPLITSEVYIVNNINVKSEVTLRYTATPSSTSLFDRYRFQLSDPSIPAKEQFANETDRKVIFDGLVPGRLYNFTIWTVSHDITSRPLLRQDRLYPESITRINASYISDREITLEWDTPSGDYDAFEVQYINADERLVDNLTLQPSITITGLRPFRNYTFTVIVQCGSDADVLRKSHPFSAVFSTKESKPGKVQFFESIELSPNNITFEWSLSESLHNGILTSYVITYGLKGRPLNMTKRFDPNDSRGVIDNLQPGTWYDFDIAAHTKVGAGMPLRVTKKMPIRAPPTPDPAKKPQEVSKTSTSIRIRYRDNYFSNENGEVKRYTIIVAEDPDYIDANNDGDRSWAEVQSFNRWPPYMVIPPYNPFSKKPSSWTEFEIGQNTSCKPEHKGYCNGPLRGGRTYYIKIRAFTEEDKYSETTYQAMNTDQDSTWLIYTLVIPFSILLIFVVCLVYIRKRRNGTFGKKGRSGGHGDTASLQESIIDTSRPVKLKDFGEHYRQMSADSDFRFSEEFEELKRVGREQLCTAADLPVNRPKNRFTNILPYDQSRFKLQPTDDDEGSDYINANYVTGFNSPREFIVTQGPLPSTRDDFWRMCWESNSRAIVMLTRCVEKGREKCDRYWPPDTLPQYYGDIQVQILNESRYPDWIISEFRIQRGDQARLIKHFHFITWPDFGVPDPPQILVKFVRAFRERVVPEQDRIRPIVVHCSAGVGRSGTFIALDRILQQIKKSESIVDIFGIVYGMRKERVWMVQTEQQYICIHQCLLTVLEGKENEIPNPREIHSNDGYDDDEGIAESGM